MKLTSETKFFIGVIIVTVAILGSAIYFFSRPPKTVSSDVLIPQEVWATGSATPKITLVEFSDFECPACGAAYPVVKKVTETYKDDLRFVFRHFPLAQHKNARFAAQAAEAAGAQGKFWEMHDLLFKN
ncbi:MAG: thioredoxin domain-containing protein, partial [Patescibacteria group bacterium]